MSEYLQVLVQDVGYKEWDQNLTDACYILWTVLKFAIQKKWRTTCWLKNVMHLPQVVQKLHLILKPFLLRRIKNDVEKSLPKKKEIILYTPMTEMQKQFNDHLLKRTLHEYYEDNGKTSGMFHSQKNMSYQNLLLSWN